VANKADTESLVGQAFEFAELGFGDPLPVSAEHGYRFDALYDHLAEAAGPPPADEEEESTADLKRIHLAFVGRPNVGKSSLCNNLLQDQRLVVSEVPGTTRDSVHLDLDWHGADGRVLPYRLVDTAGLRRRKRVDHSIEYFSTLRSREAMEQADIVFLVVDAEEGVTRQDKALAGEILEAGKCVVLLVNKWDVAIDRFRAHQPEQYADMKAFRADYARHALKELFFLPDSPVLFVSALRGFSMDRVLKTARSLWETSGRQLPTPKVNRLVQDLMAARSPAFKDGKRFKAYYAVQTGNRPFTFRVFCNRATRLDEPYRRYLQRGFIREFSLRGCPVRFELRGKEVRYAGREPARRPDKRKGGRR
jgi:GTP-binding protein